MAEEAAAADLISGSRLQLGISRGSPEPALRGYEAFGHVPGEGRTDADMAREHAARFMQAISGQGMVDADPGQGGHGTLQIEPQSPGLARRIWWGAGTRATAEWSAEQGYNLMSSTLLTEDTGRSLGDAQAEQIARYRQAWKLAGHDWEPRVSVSRSIIPIVTSEDRHYFGLRAQAESRDQVGSIDRDGTVARFGKSYIGEPDRLVEELAVDAAVQEADSLLITVPTQLGVDYNTHLMESIAVYIAPSLSWEPNRAS